MPDPTAGVPGELQLDQAAYDAIRGLVYERSGISLGDQKITLVRNRLRRRLVELGLADYRAYVRLLRSDVSGAELTILLDAISTNVTYFFREEAHFDFIQQAMEQRYAAGHRRFRFWCAAASTGEEPYSLAMAVSDSPSPIDFKLLATDINTKVLSHAIEGRYRDDQLEKVPPAMKTRYTLAAGRGQRVVADELKDRILFRYLNLSELPTALSGPLDLVICRNVMIYFDDDLRRRLVQEFTRLLGPGCYLIVSHGESLRGMQNGLTMVGPSIYQKRTTGGGA